MKGLARQLSAHVLCTRSMPLPLSVRATWPLVLYEARLGTSSISDEMSHVFAGGSERGPRHALSFPIPAHGRIAAVDASS
eukprot:scaffold3059_cov215-Prasinococcus_capsulatus_cf.AAC.2